MAVEAPALLAFQQREVAQVVGEALFEMRGGGFQVIHDKAEVMDPAGGRGASGAFGSKSKRKTAVLPLVTTAKCLVIPHDGQPKPIREKALGRFPILEGKGKVVEPVIGELTFVPEIERRSRYLEVCIAIVGDNLIQEHVGVDQVVPFAYRDAVVVPISSGSNWCSAR